MTTQELLDTTHLSLSFPQLPEPLVTRTHILDEINSTLMEDADGLVLRGKSGYGKTVLAAQFAQRYSGRCISVYLNAKSRFSYDPQVIATDLTQQALFITTQRSHSFDRLVDHGEHRDAMLTLAKHARSSAQPVLILLDGLHDIVRHDPQAINPILDLIPRGLSRIKFVLTFDPDVALPARLNTTPYFPLMPFSPTESACFLRDLNLDDHQYLDLHKLATGIPGRLASIRRILANGLSVESMLSDPPQHLSDLFSLEWRSLESCDDDLAERFVAFLAYDRSSRPLFDISSMLDIDVKRALYIVETLSFLQYDEAADRAEFISEAFRQYAADNLTRWRQEVHDSIISRLQHAGDDSDAVRTLPVYFQEAGRLDDLIEYLSPKHVGRLIEVSASLGPASDTIDSGIAASLQCQRYNDLLRFAIQKSTLLEFSTIAIMQAEVEAVMALDGYAEATRLANAAPLIEDRLQLLSVVARMQKEAGFAPESQLVDLLHSLLEDLSQSVPRERLLEIARELVFTLPAEAIQLVEAAADTKQGQRGVDLAFARLAMLHASRVRDDAAESVTRKQIEEKIADPNVRKFSLAVGSLVGGQTAPQILRQVKALDDDATQIYLLRQWAIKNHTSEDAHIVIKEAIAILLRATAYTPNAHDLRELATPLISLTDADVVRSLADKFNSALSVIESRGPTIEVLRLKLMIAEAKAKIGEDGFVEFFAAYQQDLHGVEDSSVRFDATAHSLATIERIRGRIPSGALKPIKDQAETAFLDTFHELCESTAEQLEICRAAIRAVGRDRPDLGEMIAESLNVEPRRDRAFLALVKTQVHPLVDSIQPMAIRSYIERIVDVDVRIDALDYVLSRLTEPDGTPVANPQALRGYLELCIDISIPEQRCRTIWLLFQALRQHDIEDQHQAVKARVVDELKASWEKVDAVWAKVNLAFEIASGLAKDNRSVARHYFNEAHALRQSAKFESPGVAWAYTATLRIAMNAYGALLHTGVNDESDFERLRSLINVIPSVVERCNLWGELALVTDIAGRESLCRDIVTTHLRPLLDQLRQSSLGYYYGCATHVASALYRANSVSATELLRSLPDDVRDTGVYEIGRYLLEGCLPTEPFQAIDGHAYSLQYDTIIEILKLCELLEYDSLIAYFTEAVADSVTDNRNKNKYSRDQKQEIASRIERIANERLPAARFIKHSGYQILVRIASGRIRREKAEYWKRLIDEARLLPNEADRVLVLGSIAAGVTAQSGIDRVELFNEAAKAASTLPVLFDRVNRIYAIGRLGWGVDRKKSKGLLQSAMRSSATCEVGDVYEVQRRMIDFAHRLDESLAGSLINMLDDDPARLQARRLLQDRVSELQTSKKIQEEQTDTTNDGMDRHYPKATWHLLGMLNAGRVAAKHLKEMRSYLETASRLPLSDAYPIVTWAVANVRLRYRQGKDVSRIIRPVFEATVLSCEAAESITRKEGGYIRKAATKRAQSTERVLVPAGDRHLAINFIRQWLEEQASGFIKICDPFFGPEDLELVQIVLAVKPKLTVQILTSIKHHHKGKVSQPWSDSYRDYWRSKLSDQDPPETVIVVAGTESQGEPPIHDRWWTSEKSGLRIGTSFRSLGCQKDSEISIIQNEELHEVNERIDQLLYMRKKEHQGERLRFEVFTL